EAEFFLYKATIITCAQQCSQSVISSGLRCYRQRPIAQDDRQTRCILLPMHAHSLSISFGARSKKHPTLLRSRSRHKPTAAISSTCSYVRRLLIVLLLDQLTVNHFIRRCLDLGMSPGQVHHYIGSYQAPSARVSPRALRSFERYATPEQQRCMGRATRPARPGLV